MSLLYFVTLSSYPLPGGLTNRTNNLIRQLIKHGINLRLISPLLFKEFHNIEELNYIKSDPFKIISRSKRNYIQRLIQRLSLSVQRSSLPLLAFVVFFTLFRHILQSKGILSKNKRIIIQYMDERAFLPAFLSKVLSRMFGFNVIIVGDDITLRYRLLKRPLSYIVKLYEIFLVRYTDIITTSFKLCYYLMKDIRKGRPTLFVPNGINTEDYPSSIDYGKKDFRKIIFISSTLGEQNVLALNTLLEIAKAFSNEQKYRDVQFWVVGKAGLYLQKIMKDKYPDNIVRRRIKVFGVVPYSKLKELYERAGIGILPYFGKAAHSSQRIKALEYFAWGLLVVSSIDDLIGFSGLKANVHCIAVSSKDEMISKLKAILENPLKYINIAQNGRAFILENYSWDKVTRKYISTIKGLLLT